MRLRCWWFGCRLGRDWREPIEPEGGYYLWCNRCRETDPTRTYHFPAMEHVWAFLRRLHWRTTFRWLHRCEGCGRWMWRTSAPACREECVRTIPF